MSKKFMHITVYDDALSDDDINLLYKSLSSLDESYDIAVTTNNVQIATYDQDVIHQINEKLDIILENMDKFDTIRSDIRNDIKYVFGLSNTQRR